MQGYLSGYSQMGIRGIGVFGGLLVWCVGFYGVKGEGGTFGVVLEYM